MAFKLLCLTFALFCAASAAPESRIVGGTPTTIQEFPYIVAFMYEYPNMVLQRCVGSLVSSWHVLTTAYCFTGANLDNMWIRAGSTNSMSGGTEARIADIIKHPDYVETPRSADIAVVLLKEALRITESINVLYIPPAGVNLPDGMETKIVSWGFEGFPGPQIEILKTIILNKLPFAECQSKFEDDEGVAIDEGMLCASAPGRSTCMGDSGAPMVTGNVLIGLSSYFKDCTSDYPDVFTRIDSYTDWIMGVATAPGRSSTPVRIANMF